MFDRTDLESIILIADIALRMERVLNALGIDQNADERIRVLQIKKKAQEMYALTQPSTEEKVGEILSQ